MSDPKTFPDKVESPPAAPASRSRSRLRTVCAFTAYLAALLLVQGVVTWHLRGNSPFAAHALTFVPAATGSVLSLILMLRIQEGIEDRPIPIFLMMPVMSCALSFLITRMAATLSPVTQSLPEPLVGTLIWTDPWVLLTTCSAQVCLCGILAFGYRKGGT